MFVWQEAWSSGGRMSLNPYAVPAAALEKLDSAADMPAEPALPMPARVRVSLALLLITWVNATALTLYHFHVMSGHVLALQVHMSLLVLNVQMLGLYLLGTGNRIARIIALLFVVLGAPFVCSAVYTLYPAAPMRATLSVADHVLRCIAIALLFGGSASPWFRRKLAAAKADSSLDGIFSAGQQRHWPPIVLLTLILSGGGVAVSMYGLPRQILALLRAQADVTAMAGAVVLILHACAWMAVSVPAFYATWRRPAWGRVATMCFALWVGVGALLTTVLPNTSTRYLPQGEAQNVGFVAGYLMVAALATAYMACMAFGRHAQSSFTSGGRGPVSK
jgi:hypothetical protein